jgi:hypothetical protein
MAGQTNRRTPPDKLLAAMFTAYPGLTDQEYVDLLGADISHWTLADHRRRIMGRSKPKLGIEAMSDARFWGTVDGCQLERLS